jgi:putative endopeptidase
LRKVLSGLRIPLDKVGVDVEVVKLVLSVGEGNMSLTKTLLAQTAVLSLLNLISGSSLPASAFDNHDNQLNESGTKTKLAMVQATTKDASQSPIPNVDNIDKKVSPGVDFFEYANGTWLKNTPIPGDYSSWGSFNIVDEKNLATVHKILEAASNNKAAVAGSNEQKIGDFYYTGMDTAKIEADGIKPLEEEMGKINSIKSIDDLQHEIARLHQRGINVAFAFGSGQDFKDSTAVIGQAMQGGLGLPDRDYYLTQDDNSKKIRDQYVTHMTRMFGLLGQDDKTAAANAAKVMALETKLATASYKNVDLRVPEKNYHKMTHAEVKDLTPNFPWPKYLTDVDYPGNFDINVGQPEFMKELDKQLTETSLDDWKEYLTWHLIHSTAAYLSDKFVDEDFDFEGKILNGKKVNLPRWKRVIAATNGGLGEAVGQLFVKETFSPDAKARALDVVQKVRAVLKDEMGHLEWMDPETRKNAIAKLDAFKAKIGYPDKWRDYSKLQMNRDSYVGNIFKAEQFEFNRQLAKIGQPVDRNEWLMNAQAVNAYYSAEMNEIVFPAGILQPPFFDAKADDAANLGGIGMVIGHEMTHGFDDEGSKFDGSGNLKNWWSPEDQKHFDERVAHIVKQYDGYVVAGDTHLRGKLVSGEAAADLGGLTIAYKALQKSLDGKPQVKDEHGLTPDQRFFLAFAQIWATNYRPEKERLMANTNPHPTAKFRVNGTVANMEAFQKAFNLKDDATIMLPASDRCHLW